MVLNSMILICVLFYLSSGASMWAYLSGAGDNLPGLGGWVTIVLSPIAVMTLVVIMLWKNAMKGITK